MGIFDKVRVPLAFKGKNRFPLYSTTVTTSDWFTLRPVFSRELPPNSSINMKHSFYCRLSSLQKPMFGTGRVVNRAFFVPYNSIMEGFVDFIDDTNSTFIGAGTRLTHVPYAYSSDVVIAMIRANCFTNVTSTDPYDVALAQPDGYAYRKFTFKGRQIYSMFTGLGISLSFYAYHNASNAALDQSFSLMKVLAFAKIQADWYFNNNFYERSNQVLAAISRIAREPLSPGSDTLRNSLVELFNYIYYSVVDNDYFSTATVNPVTPTGASQVSITDVSNDSSSAETFNRSKVVSDQSASGDYPSTPHILGSSLDGTAQSWASNITQYVVNALAGLTSYMQRNNLVGHKAVDRMLARFGVKLDNDLIGRSYYIGSNSADLSVIEVMSNADTDGASLGAYAGRGDTGRKDAEFHFDNESKCFGVFIVLSTIIPDVHYGQGITRDNLHINRLDFLTPEFDSLGPQAIGRCELYYDAKTPGQYEDLALFEPQKSFGFQHTYSEYCKADDILSGDFRRLNTLDIRAFHMYRMFNEYGVEGSPLASNYKTISEQFVHANPSEFNKIFNYTDTDYDHFYLVHKFSFNVVQPKVPLVDTYEFHGDNEGRSIKVDLNGSKLN